MEASLFDGNDFFLAGRCRVFKKDTHKIASLTVTLWSSRETVRLWAWSSLVQMRVSSENINKTSKKKHWFIQPSGEENVLKIVWKAKKIEASWGLSGNRNVLKLVWKVKKWRPLKASQEIDICT